MEHIIFSVRGLSLVKLGWILGYFELLVLPSYVIVIAGQFFDSTVILLPH
jgi:hypothetical protein